MRRNGVKLQRPPPLSDAAAEGWRCRRCSANRSARHFGYGGGGGGRGGAYFACLSLTLCGLARFFGPLDLSACDEPQLTLRAVRANHIPRECHVIFGRGA